MKKMKQLLTLVLTLVMAVSIFTACGGNKENKEEEKAAITATAVKFSKDGKYTTTVSSKKVDLSGVNEENVEVRYLDMEAASKAEEATDATTETTEEIKIEDVYTLSAKVESVKAADKKSCEITFTDDKAATFPTKDYVMVFKGVEGEDNTASVEVEFPEITLTPDVKSVVSNAKGAKVTLAIDGSTFEDGISKKDIYLNNAFSDMKIESVSSSDKNLTVQLKGSPVRNEAGAYQWGSVNVKPSGITDGYADVTSKIDIQLASAYIDTETLKFEKGRINADLKVNGVVNIDTLTKNNIKLDGATVEAAEKANDNTVKLTIAADGIKSVNDFADLIGGKAMKLGDYEFATAVSQASFYPVFDYVEENGDNLNITLKLYANSGTFDKNLKADAISFADDFKDAKVDSIKVDSDTVATLILSVPANGQTTETFKMNGTVTLAAGALTNAWGDKTSKEASCTRDYSGETLGRAVTLNADTLLEIQKYTRGKNTLFGKICYWGGVAGKVYSIGKSVLEVAGAIKSEHQQIMEEFAAINTKLDGIHNDLISIRNDLAELKNNDYRIMLQNYQNDSDTFDKKLRDVLSVYAQAAEDIKEEYPEYKDVTVEKLTDEEIAEYNERLMKLIAARVNDISYADYCDFQDDFKEFKTKFENVCTKLASNSDENPLRLFDESCALTYNFDSQCYEFRAAQREYAKAQLTKALAVFAVRYNANKNPNGNNFKNMTDDYRAAINMIDKLSNVGNPPSEIKTDSTNDTSPTSYIGSIIVGCNWYPTNMERLTYKPSRWTINLLFKRTNDRQDAIKDFFVLEDTYRNCKKAKETIEVNGITYHLAELRTTESSAFADNRLANMGDLLYKSGLNKVLRLYYTKDELGDNKAVTNMYLDGNSGSGISSHNLQPSGSARYLHITREGPKDYVYSYIFGKKIAIGNTIGMANYDSFGGAIKNGSSYRNWTENEYNEFIRRIHAGSLKEEFKSAGIDLNNAILLNYGREKKSGSYSQYQTWTYWQYKGDVIKTNAKSKTGADLGQSYIYKYDGKLPKTKSMDVSYIELIS